MLEPAVFFLWKITQLKAFFRGHMIRDGKTDVGREILLKLDDPFLYIYNSHTRLVVFNEKPDSLERELANLRIYELSFKF